MAYVNEILSFLYDLGQTFPRPLETPYQYIARLKRFNTYGSPYYYKETNKLRKRGLVKKLKIDDRNYLYPTKRGLEFIKQNLILIPRNDGFKTLLVFDIPNYKSNSRHYIRRYILKHGFNKVQKSVFISNYFPSDELRNLLKKLKLNPYVKFFCIK